MNIGITGHQRLDNPKDWEWVERKLEKTIFDYGKNITGISSLAIGADQLFAKLILKSGGTLYAVLPFEGYEQKFGTENDRKEYEKLLNQATKTEVLPNADSDEQAYFAAGKRVVELSNVLVAVWNGKKAAGLGGTGDAVQYAREMGKKVIHINPISHQLKVMDEK